MLEEPRLKVLQDLIQEFSREELIWINGYLQGLLQNKPEADSLNGYHGEKKNGKPPVLNGKARTISLVYGTETGNAKKLAGSLSAASRKSGVHMKLQGLDQYRFSDLEKEEYFFVIISTQGEGEPPVNAKKFYEHIHSVQIKNPNLKFAVLGLGDTAYPLYCKTGEDIDQQLERIGGQRLLPLQKCDVDFDADAEAWFEKIIGLLEKGHAEEVKTQVPKKHTGRKYYNGKIVANINLNDKGSLKETYHIEIQTDEEVAYEPGDALAIVPFNRKSVVDGILRLTGLPADYLVETAKFSGTAEELLLSNLNICYLLTATLKKYANLTGHTIPDTRMDLIDLLRIYPVENPEQFVEVLKLLTPIAPRLYSISSSPSAHSGEVHITVARNYFYAQEEQRLGLCSEFLGDLPERSPVTFYIHRNRAFKLPAADKDIIMIGPGTGIAPMRSFLAERDIRGGKGRNWLFFGEQHFVTDFLYQSEIQQHVQNGVLNRVSLAFSRDQHEKIYVQHRMEQEGQDLFDWISQGANIYISGSKEPMSVDVEQALLRIIQKHGGKTEDEASKFWEDFKNDGRYQKDVY